MSVELILPVEERTQVIVNSNEYINSSTINRGHSRLLTNDIQLRDWLEILSGEINNLNGIIATILGMGGGSGIIATTGAVIFGAFNDTRLASYYGSGVGSTGLIADSGYSVNDIIYATNTRTNVYTGVTPGSPQYDLTTADNGKVFVDDSVNSFNYNLPTLTGGVFYTFVKLTSAALYIKAQSDSTIADSPLGGHIQNTTTEPYATIKIIGVDSALSSVWVIEGGHGTWTTTT